MNTNEKRRLVFTCPLCGVHEIDVINSGVTITSPLKEVFVVDEGGEMEETVVAYDVDNEKFSDGEARYQCRDAVVNSPVCQPTLT
jgi:hypothetical protein